MRRWWPTRWRMLPRGAGIFTLMAVLIVVVLLSRLIAPKPKAKPQAEPVAEAPKADVVVTEPLRQAA